MSDAKLVVIKSYGNHVEAELAKSALDSAGIPAIIQADSVGGMREHIAWSGSGSRVLVREEDAASALDVLSTTIEEKSDPAESRSPWRRFT